MKKKKRPKKEKMRNNDEQRENLKRFSTPVEVLGFDKPAWNLILEYSLEPDGQGRGEAVTRQTGRTVVQPQHSFQVVIEPPT